MVMMGLEDTGEVPFRYVYLHGLIRDEKGEKMSKTKGNVLNPLDALEKYGTDAMRFGLLTGTSPGNDSKLSADKLESGQNFANKLWNATRFVIRSITPNISMTIQQNELPVEDRWILSRLNQTIATVTSLMQNFEFGEAQRTIYDFLWGDYCDWYIELAKVRLRSSESCSPVPVLVHVLETSLRLLHPFMPFVTEELWQNIKNNVQDPLEVKADSIMVSSFPVADKTAYDQEAERVMGSLIEIIHSLRNTRAQYKVEMNRWIESRIYAGNLAAALQPYSESIQALGRVRPVVFLDKHPEQQGDNMVITVLKEVEVFIPLSSMVDMAAEKSRLEKEAGLAQGEIDRLETRLADNSFLTKAPAAVIEKERQKLADTRDRLARLQEQIGKINKKL